MLFLSAICWFILHDPVVTMREKPDHESKVVSQAIFSEELKIVEQGDEWSYVSTPDNYLGWIPSESITKRSSPYEPDLKVSRLCAHLYTVKDTEYGPCKSLPYGSRLQSLDGTDARWVKVALPDGQECYIQKGDLVEEPSLLNQAQLVEFSQKFLGLPYTWGGRSSFGYDCSGFVQMLYAKIGINLERDARLQIKDSRLKQIPIDQLQAGNLIFFGKSKEKIVHVGLFLGNDQFIHSTVKENQPWIRISRLSDPTWSGREESDYPYRMAYKLQ